MKGIWISAALGLSVLAMQPALAAAQVNNAVTLSSDIRVEKTVVENGRERKVLEAPKVVVPGDRLLFAVSYRNTSTAEVRNFVLTNPLPTGVMLAPDSAGALDVSVDAGKSWGRLAALKVADGKGGTRPAQASDVTHVRWVLAPLAPGAGSTVTFHAIVR
jgi:uncharacterized repeat protein (TIGR01451 family)